MLLNKEVSNYIKEKIKWNSIENRELVQYILELCKLDKYIKNWFKWSYYMWFWIDFLIDKHFNDYIELLSEIKWKEESEAIKKSYIKKNEILCKWVDFSQSWELDDLEDIWLELGWKI